MDYEITDFCYSALRKGFELRGKLGTQVRWVPRRLNTPAEEFYREKGSGIPVSPLLEKVPTDARRGFLDGIIAHLDSIIGTRQHLCSLDLMVDSWDRHIRPHCKIDALDMPLAMSAVRVSTKRLEEESRSQLTTARECLSQALKAGWFPYYLTWDTWSAAEIDRVGIRLAIDLGHQRRIKHVLYANMTRSSRNTLDGLVALACIRDLGVRIWLKPRDDFEFQEADPSSSIRMAVIARELGMGQAEWAHNILLAQKTIADSLRVAKRWPSSSLGNKPFLRIPRGAVFDHGWPVERMAEQLGKAAAVHALLTTYGRSALQSVAWAMGRQPRDFEFQVQTPLLHGNLVTPAARNIENYVPGLAVYTKQAHDELIASVRGSRPGYGPHKPTASVSLQDYRKQYPLRERHLASGGAETVVCPQCPTPTPMKYTSDVHRGIDLVFRYECPHGHSVTVPDATWSLTLDSQLTPHCPTCGHHPCQETEKESFQVYQPQSAKTSKRVLYWYRCPQCRLLFCMPWQFKGALVRQWARMGRLQAQVEALASASGWNPTRTLYDRPDKRKPRFRESGQSKHASPSTRGYWTINDLLQICARHIEGKPRFRHTIADLAYATGGLPLRGVGDGEERWKALRQLLDRSHLLLERVHGRRFVSWQKGTGPDKVIIYELEEKP